MSDADTLLLEKFAPDLTYPSDYIKIVLKHPENFKNGEERVFDIFDYNLSYASQYGIICKMIVNIAKTNNQPSIRCYLTQSEHICLETGDNCKYNWMLYMDALADVIRKTDWGETNVTVNIDVNLKELYIHGTASIVNDDDDVICPADTTLPALFVPDLSIYTTTIEDIGEYIDAKWREELTPCINEVASYIDNLLKSRPEIVLNTNEYYIKQTVKYNCIFHGKPEQFPVHMTIQINNTLTGAAEINFSIKKIEDTSFRIQFESTEYITLINNKSKYIITRIAGLFSPLTECREIYYPSSGEEHAHIGHIAYECLIRFPKRHANIVAANIA
jgi:ribosome biogenesis protein Nip4